MVREDIQRCPLLPLEAERRMTERLVEIRRDRTVRWSHRRRRSRREQRPGNKKMVDKVSSLQRN